MTGALVVPVGHYAGAFHTREGGPPECYRVRLGWDDHELTEAGIRVWALAHGVPGRLSDGVAWNREALLAAAGADPTGARPSGRLLDDLTGVGLVAEVDPDSDDAVAFARRHRLEPLMVGLGNTSADPSRWAIGFGTTPVLTVSVAAYHIWKYAHLRPNLWAGCEAVAALAAWHPGAESGTEDLLRDFLTVLHPLLACSAAYLDLAQ